VRKDAPETWQPQLSSIEDKFLTQFSAQEAIEREKMRYAQEDKAFYRLNQQLSTALRELTPPGRDEIRQAASTLTSILILATTVDSTANFDELKDKYHKASMHLIRLEVAVLPAQKELLEQSEAANEAHAWKMVSLERVLKGTEQDESGTESFYKDILPALPPDLRLAVEKENSSIASETKTLSDRNNDYEDAIENLGQINEKISDHFEHSIPRLKRRFETLSADDDMDSPEFDRFLSSSSPTLAASRQKALAKLRLLDSEIDQATENIEQSATRREQYVAARFPSFMVWARLLASLQRVSV